MEARPAWKRDDRDHFRRYRPKGEEAGPARAQRVRRARRGLIALALVIVAAIAVGWNPPVGDTHAFSELSDYDSERESGCTNSGEGCHGYETEYIDFNDYHPDAECTTCHEYQGVGCIPCHSPENLECPVCHDGSMPNSADRVRLEDPYPSGHYRETTHTALGSDFDMVVRAHPEGVASATCGECHSRDLRESHTDVPMVPGSVYGASIGCGECHNDVRSYGMAEVLDDWPGRLCEDCHKPDASAPMHDTRVADSVESSGTLGCASTGAGCHDVVDLHALHPDAPESCSGSASDDEPGCHDLDIESHAPTARACGSDSEEACHAAYLNDEYSHEHDAEVHAPNSRAPAADTSFAGVPCGACHMMEPDKTSLTDEHGRWTSVLSLNSADVCANCHNHTASLDAVHGDWSARDSRSACSTCHGIQGLDAAHADDLDAVHDSTEESPGCSSSGPGCHPTGYLHDVGVPTTSGGLHASCLRCHDWREAPGNRSWDPSKKACGSGRDCHAIAGHFDPSSSIHRVEGEVVDGADPRHDAGQGQSRAVFTDRASGVVTACGECHASILSTEHSRTNSSLAAGRGTLCARCHNADLRTASVVKGSWAARATSGACDACHGGEEADPVHHDIDEAHVAIQIGRDGSVSPDACSRAGCHGTADLRQIHSRRGCTIGGCHRNSDDIRGSRKKTCGGTDEDSACHVVRHIVDHSANLSGSVGGVTYTVGANVGCFGCHDANLVTEHANALAAGQMEGTAGYICAVCHANPFDPGRGTFAALPNVAQAVASADKRCIACHASGSTHDGPVAVASPHKDISAETTLPAGKVWADPFDEWRIAFTDAGGGGGHNVLPSGVVHAPRTRTFPGTSFAIGGRDYTWTLPANAGATAWLRTSVFGPSAETTEGIQHIALTCEDCHIIPPDMVGPHGAAARAYIDPEYSQTEYANPTTMASQWEATGSQRVVCLKCHSMNRGDGVAPGGNALHGRHAWYQHRNPPVGTPEYYGAKCIDCHTRVPHAWRRPRLLVRTHVNSDGVEPDIFPYVRRDHEGLLGIVLRDYDGSEMMGSANCAVGGCYSTSTPTRHPKPSMMPTSTVLWP